MRLQPIYDIAELCAQQGVTDAVVCPGSRCAPLTLAFVKHTKVKTRTFSDERSAAFIAMGIAQQTNKTVSLVCTSGSAAYNFAPAIAEAFFQEIPLLVFTADRPAEWIDQLDGQTIRQRNIFGAHVKKSFELPQDYEQADAVWHINRIVNEAIITSQQYPKGPVHINVPLREPLYPGKNETISFTQPLRIVESIQIQPAVNNEQLTELKKSISKFSKVLVVGGQHEYHDGLLKSVNKFCTKNQAALVGDVISNLHPLPDAVRFVDSFLGQCNDSVKKSLKPELLITFGKSVISKNLKIFLRKYKPVEHWHIQPSGFAADVFQSITRMVYCTPEYFFQSLHVPIKIESFNQQKKENYVRLWQAEESRTLRSQNKYFGEPAFAEFHVLKEIMQSLPPRCNLHLANSMSVRYANFIGLTEKQKGVHVFSNRGASGIDGCTSTSVGHALSGKIPNILITGDMAFFYDRNAFWHNYPLSNLHIVMVNNNGGVIFNVIDGPGSIEEKDEYFITNQKLSAAHLATEFGFTYLKLDSRKKVPHTIKDFFEFDGRTKILEIESNQQTAKEYFEKFKNTIKNGYEA